MISIVPYSKEQKQDVLELFISNISDFFDVSEEVEFIKYLDTELESYVMAKEGNVILGSGGVNFFMDQRTARIAWDLIHPNYHGIGIGKKLTQYRIKLINTFSSVDTIIVKT